VIIGIQPDPDGRFRRWFDYLKARGIDTLELNLMAPDALEQAKRCSGIMWNWAHFPREKHMARVIVPMLEQVLGLPIYPNLPTAWHYDEKIAQHYLLRELNAPVPDAWLFWEQAAALAWAEQAPYPLVFKLSAGAGSTNVLKVENEAQAARLIKRMFHRGVFPNTLNEQQPKRLFAAASQFRGSLRRLYEGPRYILTGDYPSVHRVFWEPEHSYSYFQEFLPDNGFDTRVTVIGDRAFAFRRMNRPGDFRASGSGNFATDPAAIDQRCIEIALQTSERGKFQCMAYDFLFKQGQPVIVEISYTFSTWVVQSCPGHWNKQRQWVEGHLWPEDAQVEDFVAYVQQHMKAL
jgi:RimK-like ATP-grasp domain